jgi:hypothetical protein
MITWGGSKLGRGVEVVVNKSRLNKCFARAHFEGLIKGSNGWYLLEAIGAVFTEGI